jgi:hypothetical protein
MYLGLTLVYGGINAAEFGARQYVEVGVGLFFVVLGVICVAVTLTCLMARSDEKASRSLSWLGSLKPAWH